MSDSCIFCRIASGDIPCSKVYEDENVLAFLDLGPARPGHTLVIPKEHCSGLLDFPAEKGSALLAAIQKVAAAVVMTTGAEGFNLIQNNGAAAGQSVFHLHWHIIPRVEGDGIETWKPGSYPDTAAMQALAAQISSNIGK
ncbi:MAG: HIT family protein [Mailhella sp.]|nr:HIT family protein [Mailhella sp.]